RKNTNEDFFTHDLLLTFGINVNAIPQPSIVLMNFVHSKEHGGGVNWTTIWGICNSGIVAFSSLTVIIFCSCRIIREFLIPNVKYSDATRSLQLDIFRALLVQFFIPFIFCFLPYLAIIILPLTGSRFGETGNILANVASIFPALDACMVMFMIRQFRSMIVKWIRTL
ncbi:hypothetical protein PMAYCL1PPCAC_09138, partial [Pristionchus mayeri]